MKRTALAALLMMLCLTGCGSEQPEQSSAQQPEVTESTADSSAQLDQEIKLAEQVDLLNEAREQAEKAVAKAKEEVESAQLAYSSAQKKLDDFTAEHEEDIPFCTSGALGFFSYIGAESAVAALKESTYASFTDPESDADAVSFENVQKTFDLLRECNNLRTSADPPLPELMITDQLMAVAEANLNWSDTTLEHSAQFNFDENLAWTEGDPFVQWTDAASADFDESARNNVYSPTHTQTGFAVCTKNGMGDYPTTYCQVFSGAANSPAYTVDEYEAKFTEFSDRMGGIKDELTQLKDAEESTKSILEKKNQALDEAVTAYQDATEAYQQAVSVYNWYN